MTALVVSLLYLLAGAGSALLSRARGGSLSDQLAAVLFWPYLLPFLVHADPRAPDRPGSREREISAGERRLADALLRAGGAEPVAGGAAEVGQRFGHHLRHLDSRVGALESAMQSAPEGIRSSLEELRAQATADLDTGLHLLDELSGKLTLLAFADDSGPSGGELEDIRSLIRQLESMTAATQEVASTVA